MPAFQGALKFALSLSVALSNPSQAAAVDCATCAGGSTAVGTAPYTLSLFCSDPGATLSALQYISWGDNDSGVCGAPSNSSDPCDQGGNVTRTREVVEGACLGKAVCSLNVTTQFLGPYCAKGAKASPVFRLTVSMVCTGGASAAASSTCQSLGPGLYFSNQLTDYAVLQRAPAAAALYGYVPKGSYGAGATIKVTLTDESGAAPPVVVSSAPIVNDPVWPLATWKAVLPPAAPSGGGNYSATAACEGCYALPFFSAPAVIRNLTYGDVWACSGQSNVQLSMSFTFGLNASKAAIRAGRYANVRYYSTEYADQFASPLWVQQKYIGGGYFNQWTPAAGLVGQADGDWLESIYATCWYFAQELSVLLDAEAGGANLGVPIGIIGTAQGGTQIESWTPAGYQAACSSISCLCSTPHCNSSQPFNPENCTGNGGLFNGLIAPYANLSIRGAIWYQLVHTPSR